MSGEAGVSIPNRTGGNPPVHFLIVPLMAPGHMIPMLDLARLLAARGVLITFCTTPVNLARIRTVVDRAVVSALPIHFVALDFPVADAGLPEGCENTDLIPSADLMLHFLNALPLLRHSLRAQLRAPDPDCWPPPACLISDFLHHWTADVAQSLDVPRLIFHGTSCFFLVCCHLVDRQKPDLQAAMAAASDGGPIPLPGLPQPILVSKHQTVSPWDSHPGWSKFMEAVLEAEKSADGVLVNSFAELEPWYLKRCQELRGMPIFPIGPLSLYKEEAGAKANRGRASSVDNKLLFRWLDEQKAGSVVLVIFGSTARDSKAQLVELGCGLEASGWAFVWVLSASSSSEIGDDDQWAVGFEKRVEGRGMIVRGWAPQVVMLGHPAVGGFLTHCGWNSTLEAVAAGVVMATWPHFWDQFFNERFVVDVLKTGLAVGVEEPTELEEAPEAGSVVKVKREDVQRVVERLMDGGEEGRARRARARELSEMARRAMEEGGSSSQGFHDLIAYIVLQSTKKKEEVTD